jgi:hypothetical protein
VEYSSLSEDEKRLIAGRISSQQALVTESLLFWLQPAPESGVSCSQFAGHHQV